MQIYNHYRRYAVGIVAVTLVGMQANTESKRRFLAGYSEMMKRLEPETVIFYGNVPEECFGNIVRVRAFQEKFRNA